MSLGIAFFKDRELPFAIATETGQFYCGKDEKTFTHDVDEAYFFATQKEAAEGLEALKELLSKPEEEMTKIAVKEKPAQEAPKAEEKKKPDVHPMIKEIVLKILGKPKDFMKIDTINVYDNRYRVNIWVKGNNGAKISDNFFVKFENGQIVSCDPPLNKKYE